MSKIPDDPNILLLRGPTADALTAAGYPIKSKTLATKATRGGGPPYRLFGQRALYRWGDALAWAQDRLTLPRVTTSEMDVDHPTHRRSGLDRIKHGTVGVPPSVDQGAQKS